MSTPTTPTKASASNQTKATPVQLLGKTYPTIPPFQIDRSKPNCASSWIRMFHIRCQLYNLTGAEKCNLFIGALDEHVLNLVAYGCLPERIEDVRDIKKLETRLRALYDASEAMFATRYKILQVEWKGPDDEPVPEIIARIQNLSAMFTLQTFDETNLQITLLLLSMKEPSLERLRTRVLDYLNSAKAPQLSDCQQLMTDALSLVRDQKLPERQSPQVAQVFQRPKEPWPCTACGSKEHAREECKYKDADCHKCGKLGHLARVCRQMKPGTRRRHGKVSQVQVPVIKLQSLTKNSQSRRRFTDVIIRGSAVRAQIDTGADISILKIEDYMSIGAPKLEGSSFKAKAANQTTFTIDGFFETEVEVCRRRGWMKIYVADIGDSLLGMDAIEQLELDKVPLSTYSVNRVEGTSRLDGKEQEGLVKEFPKLFEEKLGKCTKVKVQLPLQPDADPVFIPPRRCSLEAKEVMEKEIARLLEAKILYPVEFSQFATPGSVVRRKDGRPRFVVDFSTGLNDRLLDAGYPLPTPSDILDRISGAKVFSQLDFSEAYHQLELDQDAQKIVTVSSHIGLFRYRRLPFGLKTAPSIFQQTMDSMLTKHSYAWAYLDDILIASPNVESHKKHVRAVLSTIEEFGFTLRQSKCKFFMDRVKFLGRIIDADGVHPDPDKVKAIMEMAQPTDQASLRSFLGLVNYYQSFVANLQAIRAPLDNLLKKEVEWRWSDEETQAFERLQNVFTSETSLTHYDPQLPIVVAADASSYGVGGVISHRFPDGYERPIQFFSKTLNPAQQRYSQTEKEALALLTAVQQFRRYLEGRKFVLLTDHQALLAIFGTKKKLPTFAANRLHRWAAFLASFDFQIEYRSTRNFGQADALSRLVKKKQLEQDLFEEDDELSWHINSVEADIVSNLAKYVAEHPTTVEEVREAGAKDPEWQFIADAMTHGWTKPSDSKWKCLFDNRLRFTMVDEVILFDRRVYVPQELRKRVLAALHEGHLGSTRMTIKARNFVYWPNMSKEIRRMVSSCDACAMAARAPPKKPPLSWMEPTGPGERLHIDFCGPIQGHQLLVCVDAYSKWPEVYPMKTTTVHQTLKALKQLTASHGIPTTIVSDNGPQFTSEEFARWCRQNGVIHRTCAPYYPQSNGQAERFVDIVKRFLHKKAYESRPNSWCIYEAITEFLRSYRTSPNTVIGRTPAEAHLGRKMRTSLELLTPSSFDKVSEEEEGQFQVNDRVWMRKKQNEGWMLGTLVKKEGRRLWRVEDEHGKIQRRHVDQLRKSGKPARGFEQSAVMDELSSWKDPSDGTMEMAENGTSAVASTSEAAPMSTPSRPLPEMARSPSKFLRRTTRIPKPVKRFNITSTKTKSYE